MEFHDASKSLITGLFGIHRSPFTQLYSLPAVPVLPTSMPAALNAAAYAAAIASMVLCSAIDDGCSAATASHLLQRQSRMLRTGISVRVNS